MPGSFLAVYGRWTEARGVATLVSCQDGANHDRNRDGGGFGGLAVIGKPSWRDQRVSVRVLGGTDVPNVLLRTSDPWTGIQFGRYGDRFRLYVLRDGANRLVADAPAGPPRYPEVLAAEIRGMTLRASSDGKTVFEHTFAAGEVPTEGKAGLQCNHPGARFDQLAAERLDPPTPAAKGDIAVSAIDIRPGVGAARRIRVRVRDSAGRDDLAAVYCEVTARGATIPTEPLRRARAASATEVEWEGTLFALYDGPIHVSASVHDRADRTFTSQASASLTSPPGSTVALGSARLNDLVDPHPVWRGQIMRPDPGLATRTFTNYCWSVRWGPTSVQCSPFTVERERPGKPYVGRKIVADDPVANVRPLLRLPDGRELAGPVRRYLASPTTLFAIQPTYEMDTPEGKLTWWALIENGGPILRFGGTFVPKRDLTLSAAYTTGIPGPRVYSVIEGAVTRQPNHGRGWPTPKQVAGNFVAWHISSDHGLADLHQDERGRVSEQMLDGPELAIGFSRRPGDDFGPDRVPFDPVRLSARQSYELPLLALYVVDACTGETEVPPTLAYLARAALAVPSLRATYSDLPAASGKARVRWQRSYRVVPNDFGIKDEGQTFWLPWCAAVESAKAPAQPLEPVHSAFGAVASVRARAGHVDIEMPLPDLSPSLLTPAYASLTGDWLNRAAACIDYLATLQRPDGTFRKYERMDHYSLGRMTLGLMMAYRGLAGKPKAQAKIAAMVRLALARMTGQASARPGEAMNLRKGFSGGADTVSWAGGARYEPFTYSPAWDLYTEMNGMVDQNLGHAHLLYTLLLYGAYVDPGYLKREDIRARLRELIRFQWMSQDWNGDIWRVVVGGYDAAGSGDGYEEDLAMVIPALASRAGLGQLWQGLARRISSLKYGALRRFDYLPTQNQWGYEFLTPMHHPTDWTPESGWNREYRGDVWYTGPATCGGIYGPWYVDAVYRDRPGLMDQMWYWLLEDARDTIAEDGRHWLTIGGYCTEARLVDPFLGAVKLMRAFDVARERGYLTPKTEGENIWNFAFYPAAMTVVNQELLRHHPFMRGASPVALAASTPDREKTPAYAWRTTDGAVVGVAACRLKEPIDTEVRVDTAKLGLPGGRWRVVDLKSGAARALPAGRPIAVRVEPHSATTLRITAVR